VEHLESTMGWSSTVSPVVSGFGKNGDVANGGFEGSAPFGGYGWRYGVNRTDVIRMLAPQEAKSGDYLLALINGGKVHQPNPAMPGQTVSVTLWMRGKLGGAQGNLPQ